MLRARLRDAFARVDYLLTYALARFAQQVLERRLVAADLLLVAAAVAALSVAANPRGVLGATAQSAHKVAAVLFAQHLLTGMPRPGPGRLARLAREAAAAFAAVVLLPTLLAPLLAEEAVAQVTNLVFFIFSENSAQLTRDPELDLVLPVAAALVLWATQTRAPHAAGAESTVLHAIAMLATNVLIETLFGTETSALHIVALLAALVFFDRLAARLTLAAPLRDYAVWRSAALLLALLLARGAALDSIVLGASIAAGAAHAAGAALGVRADAVVSLGLLVAGNAALEAVHGSLTSTPPRIALGVLLGVINVVHLALRAL
jgi:hypothetical protein